MVVEVFGWMGREPYKQGKSPLRHLLEGRIPLYFFISRMRNRKPLNGAAMPLSY